MTSCATLRMLQRLEGYHQNNLSASLAAAEDVGVAELAQSPGFQYDHWHPPPGPAPDGAKVGPEDRQFAARVLQFVDGRPPILEGARVARGHDRGVRVVRDPHHQLARESVVTPCPPCDHQSRVVQYDRGRQVAQYDHTYRNGPRLQPPLDRGSAGGGEIMVAAAAEIPSVRLSPLAAAFVPRTPAAVVVAAAPLNPLAALSVP